jgi:Na+-translocating ferredoxin:NAD+ oxidoreductase RnfG subunit
MAGWIRLTAPAALVASIASPAYAVQYLSVAQAQRQAFPSATNFVAVDGRAWKAQAGDRILGLFVVDHVIGKHLYIDYSVALDASGRIQRVDILQYRESYGGEVRDGSWLSQFVGKSSASALRVGQDVRNISGATLSSHHVTEGVKRIVAAYGGRAR